MGSGAQGREDMTIIVKDAGHDTDGLRRVTVQPFNDLDATAVRQAKIQQRQGRGGVLASISSASPTEQAPDT